jgi:sialidase-1
MKLIQLASTIVALLTSVSNIIAQVSVFENGKDGYICYRIPAIVKAPNGDLFAFAEGRKNNCNDHGDVDIVLKKSKDNGLTWGKLSLVASNGEFQTGNSAPVYDMLDKRFEKGRLFLIYNTGSNASEYDVRLGKAKREVWYKTSLDDGQTWSEPINISSMVMRQNEDWRAYANTPGHAFQLTKGEKKGRIFVAANHSKGNPVNDYSDYQAHGFYSDDHGATWKVTPTVEYPASNESTAAELPNGGIVMNIRDQSGKSKRRIVAYSHSAGERWDTVFVESQLPDPVCQGSMINYSISKKKNLLLFSNLNHEQNRENLTLYATTNSGKQWINCFTICEGNAAYSDLVILSNKAVGVLYEIDDYTKIVYQMIPKKVILQAISKDKSPKAH